MNCQQFRSWLENRDFSDQSESDLALKHRRGCHSCQQLFLKDNMLDQAVEGTMVRQPLPDNLEKIVSLNLGSTRSNRKRLPTMFIRMLSMTAGVAALVLLFLFIPTDYSERNEFGKSLVHDHIGHNYDHDLETIDDLDQWLVAQSSFGAHLPAKFAAKSDYRFIGARICVIDNCTTLHLVYRKGAGLVSLYIIDAKQVKPELRENKTYTVTNNGYKIQLWKEQQQVYAVII